MINFFKLVNKSINSITSLDNTLSIICEGIEYAIDPDFNKNIRSIIIANGLIMKSKGNILNHVECYTHANEIVFELFFENGKTRILIDCESVPKNYEIELIRIGSFSILNNPKLSDYDNIIRNNLIYKFMYHELTKFNFLLGKTIRIQSFNNRRTIKLFTDQETYLLTIPNGRHGLSPMTKMSDCDFNEPIISMDKCIHLDKIKLSLISNKRIVQIIIPYKKINSFKINIEEGFNLLEESV